MLIVGGTASISGEESRHVGNLREQARETFLNLGSVSFPSSCHLELLQASLCRPELLIEIEGLAVREP